MKRVLVKVVLEFDVESDDIETAVKDVRDELQKVPLIVMSAEQTYSGQEIFQS